LTPYTTYYYRISGVDSQGRQPSTNPAVKTFITHGAPLITVYPTTVNIGYNQATIKWTTNYKTTSYVGYSDQNSGFTSSDPTQWGRWNYNIDKPTTQNNLDYVGNYTAMKTDHSVTIGGLSPATTYYFRVTGKDYPYVGSFSNFSDVVSFTTPEQGGTPPPPVPAPAPVITFTSGSNNPTPTIMATDPTKYTITTSFNTGSVLTVASIAYTRAEGGSWAPPTDPTVASTLRHQTPAATHSFTIGSLIPGTYTFTVYAKQPGTSDLLSNAGGSFSVTAATTAACGTSVGSVCCATSPKCTVNAATSVFLHCTGSVCSSFRSLVISPAQWFAGFNGNNLYDLNGDGRVGGKDYALWLQAGNSL